MANFDLPALAVKALCPTNQLICDDKGLPGVYVQRAPQTLNNLLNTSDTSVHPAFIVNGAQVNRLFFGKYQGIVHQNRLYSLPGEDPANNINLDTIVQYCRNKGAGHHCITAAEWAFLALLAKKNGTMPKGNNNYGKDHSETSYIAIPSMARDDSGRIQRIATGTGPMTWSDTGEINGVFGLNGNIWEWCPGIRMVYGELQVIPYNDAALAATDLSATSTAWRAINAQATGWNDLFITPDGTGTTENSVKLDFVSSHWQWQATAIANAQDSTRDAPFASTTYGTDLSEFCKMYLRAMALGPDAEDTAYNDDRFYANNRADERCAYRGGGWDFGVYSGVFALGFGSPRAYVRWYLGGRPAYYD